MTTRRIGYIAAAVAIALATSSVAQARDIPSDGLTFDDVVAWLRDQGLEGKLTSDEAGNKYVQTDGGTRFGVYLFDCSNDHCGSVQFAANWPANAKISAARVNEWNRTKRWLRGYLDVKKGLWLEFDADLTPGGTYEMLNDELATLKKSLDSAKKFFEIK